jgi:hypothetical protein
VRQRHAANRFLGFLDLLFRVAKLQSALVHPTPLLPERSDVALNTQKKKNRKEKKKKKKSKTSAKKKKAKEQTNAITHN